MAEIDLRSAAKGAIVVGMDDSPSARVALATALQEGVRRGTGVLAVTVYGSATAWSREVSMLLDEDRAVGEVQRAARRIVDEVVAEVRERGEAVPPLQVGLQTGNPSDVLCRLTRESTLLVIGDRGRGELVSRIVGSVVLGVVVHATCPVLVVRPPRGAVG